MSDETERLIGIIAALRCTENIFEPMPARRKHDAIFKQHDEFLLTFIDRYPNHFDKYVWEHIRPAEALAVDRELAVDPSVALPEKSL